MRGTPTGESETPFFRLKVHFKYNPGPLFEQEPTKTRRLASTQVPDPPRQSSVSRDPEPLARLCREVRTLFKTGSEGIDQEPGLLQSNFGEPCGGRDWVPPRLQRASRPHAVCKNNRRQQQFVSYLVSKPGAEKKLSSGNASGRSECSPIGRA
jgi:hypothetical protein